MKTKLFYLLTIAFTASFTGLQGQDCIKCDTNSNNSGEFATALGDSTTASGLASFASGYLTRADGNWSTASGRNTTASGVFSFAGGENSISEGYRSFSFGRSVYSSGTNSFATGTETESSGNSSFAVGKETKAMGDYSFTSGFRSEAIEMYTTAIGFYSLATSSAAISIGSTVKSSAHRSVVIGSGGPWNEGIFFENSIPRSFMVGFSSTLPTLFVSESPASANFDRTGRIGIGNMTAPQAKLHIYSDDTEASSLFLEPSNWNTDYNAQIWLGDTSHGISAEVDRGLVFSTGNHFEFNNGYLGIGTEEPSALFDVNGTARIRSLAGNGERFVVADSAGNLSTTGFSGQCVSCNETTVTGEFASAIGNGTQALGDASFASGLFSIALELGSTSIGFRNSSNGLYSTTLGNFLIANTAHSIVIGDGYDINYELINDKPYSLMIGFESTKPTFFINTSPGINKTGHVAIGNMTDPQAKLHIYADDDEAATLFLEPSNWNADYNAQIWLGNQQHGISANVGEGMVYQTEENHVFKGGDIYIEDIGKGVIMTSPDGKCWRGTIDNNGSLNFAPMETCPGSPNAISESGASGTNNGLKVYPNPANDYLNIEIENTEHSSFTITLIDEKGSVVLTKQMHTEKTQIYTGDLKSGVYLVRLSGEGRQMVEKVIRQ